MLLSMLQGESAGDMLLFMEPRQLIAACWILFVFYWIVSARSIKPAAEHQSWTSMLAHRVPVWLGAILLFMPRATPFGMMVIPHTVTMESLGVAICMLGLSAAIWSRKTLADNWSSNVEFKQDHKLVERGPYHFVRHPIYTSLLLMCLGTAIVSSRLAAMVSLLLYFTGFWIKLKQEERLLLRHFPDEYPAYQARVKALVPFLF
jgi:protein-S-isoprenylcysteine O-methyltransferase Ste14